MVTQSGVAFGFMLTRISNVGFSVLISVLIIKIKEDVNPSDHKVNGPLWPYFPAMIY